MGKSFYVIIVGAVSVQKMHDGQDVVLARMGAGECFGEMALVRDDIRTATVVAVRDCAALCFERERIDAHPQIAHPVYKNIAAILAKRLEERSGQSARKQHSKT